MAADFFVVPTATCRLRQGYGGRPKRDGSPTRANAEGEHDD
jgi:hypothetical protein